MDDEILEKLLTKFIGLTEFGVLKWHFAGDVSKAYVTIYRDSRLKLTDKGLDITEFEGETVRLDIKLYQEPIPTLLDNLYKAAKESSGRFRTGAVKAVSSNSLTNTCQKLLEDNEEVTLCKCLICNLPFDPNRSYNHIAHKEANEQGIYICQECVNKVGLAEAQARLEKAIRSANNTNDDPINGDTMPGLSKKSLESQETIDNRKSESHTI